MRLYSEQFRSLLDSGALSDVTFLVEGEFISAHRAILSARSEYFHAMFRVGGMSESRSGSEASPILIPAADRASFKRMLEFLYTNSVRDLALCSAVEIIALLTLANEYLMKVKQPSRIFCSTIDNEILDWVTQPFRFVGLYFLLIVALEYIL